jgi:hypothetical protein
MSLWQNLTPYDGGVSGWRLLWDRWCPIPSLRYSCPGFVEWFHTLHILMMDEGECLHLFVTSVDMSFSTVCWKCWACNVSLDC